MEEERVSVIISEKKKVIDKIKRKYSNSNMEDFTALKIASLEVTNRVLSKASSIAGIIFVIDLIVPDPVIGIDEVALGTITTTTKVASGIIDRKIKELAKTGNTELELAEAMKLGKVITDIKNSKENKIFML